MAKFKCVKWNKILDILWGNNVKVDFKSAYLVHHSWRVLVQILGCSRGLM